MNHSVDRRSFLQAGAALAAAQVASTAVAAPPEERFLGVTVLPEYIQSEGIDGVLDNLVHRVGANAVAISPYVMAEADKETGNREPPADAGAGSVRLLDRPLWGKREVWVVTAPSFVPNRALYKGLRYQPPEPSELTREAGSVVGQFIKVARQQGLKVYFQVQAAIPPGYRVQFGGPTEQDRPRLPSGKLPPRRLAKNGSLASKEILNYEHALIRDLLSQYPDIDGIRFDWPEYPPYFLDSVFLDFSDHARQAAADHGFDFDVMRRDVGSLYAKMHGKLTNADLERWLDADGGRFGLLREVADRPGVVQFIRFKSALVENMIAGFRQVIDQAGGKQKELMPNAFPPPWTIASGMDFARVAPFSRAISVKLYTMHWPMILRFYGDQLMAANPKLSGSLLTRFLLATLDIADRTDQNVQLTDFSYPAPDIPHPVGEQAQHRKIVQAQRAAGATPVYALAHGYGPIEDFRRRLQIAHRASPHGMWVNRYAYLTNDKLDAIGRVGRG